MQNNNLSWKWYSFPDLTPEILYEILKMRQEVFIVEQNCVYLDCDGRDQACMHLTAWKSSGEKDQLVAYLRILPPTLATSLPAIGRLITHPEERGSGLARITMQKGLKKLSRLYPNNAIQISAQHYLVEFYASLGFKQSSEIYLEDGIPHLEMILTP